MCSVQAKLAEYKLKADLDLIEGSMTVLTTRLELFCVLMTVGLGFKSELACFTENHSQEMLGSVYHHQGQRHD